jgi:hypothetical protein
VEWKLTLEVNPQVVGVKDLELANYGECERETDELWIIVPYQT